MRSANRVRLAGALALGVVALAVLGGTLVWSNLAESRAPLAFAVSAIGVIFFLGVLMLGSPDPGSFRSGAVRHAIAAAFVTSYLTLLAFLVWNGPFEDSPLAGRLLDSFTGLMQIIVPFYFASEAVIQCQRMRGAESD